MSPKEIIEQCTENGLTLSITDDGNLDVVGSQDWIDIWSPILRENKSAILAELGTSGKSCQRQNKPSIEPLAWMPPLAPVPPLACNVSVTPEVAQQPFNECSTAVYDASAMRTHSDGRYSATVTDASTDPVLVEVTIAGQASFTLEIPKAYYDGLALLELLEKHNETHSVISGLSQETQGIDNRRAA